MAKFWRQAGHRVTVIAGSLNYATGKTADGNSASRWTLKREEDGTDVWRCYVPSSYNAGFLGRVWALLAFVFSGSTAAMRSDRPDVVIASSPPLTAVLPAIVATSRFRRVPWIFEVRDLWPESAVTTGVLSATSILTRALYALERFACRRATRVCVLTPAFKEDIVSRGLADAEKIFLLPNGADIELFTPGPSDNVVRAEFGWGSRLVALYAGAHGRANAIGQLVETAERLKAEKNILLVTVGDGPERKRWQAEAQLRGLDNIQFLGAVPKSRMADFINAADIGMAVLQNNQTFKTVYPNKVFDYMSCERPVLLAIDGIARELVCASADAGVFAEPENPAAIADAILLLQDASLRRRLGTNGRVWVLANASREQLAGQYLNQLISLVGAA